MSGVLATLADHIGQQQSDIVDRWWRACEKDDTMEIVSRLTRAQFRNNLPAALDGFCRALGAQPSTDFSLRTIASEVSKHGHHRWKQGFSLKQLIRDWGILNRVLVGVIDEFFNLHQHQGSAEERTIAMDTLAEFMAEATTGSVARFDELRRAEAASVARDLNSMKGQFDTLTRTRGAMLREAAHDIRGGLATVRLLTDVLKTSNGGNASTSRALTSLDQSVESLRGMLDSLLDLSRLESGADTLELCEINIADVIKRLVSEFRPTVDEKGLALLSAGPDELVVQTDLNKLRRIAQNLLVNALQYTEHGEIRVEWEAQELHWTLRIADTGPGMRESVGAPITKELDDPDRSEEDGDVSESACYKGEGIGMTIVKRLCELLDAGLSSDSQLGRGTVFTIQFPYRYPDKP
ncbi:hypothetical protein Tel_01380 [Candidatus Tenderia electrophaga]|uniref:histidine kinase n=1 Tax=Candidatus Tenderia electrophaga TaxID=1748243 RepID=A0A0S2T9S7_9GAMM|nr:hypothetical protein Tel_01380 [Candidatus Tenderia electrophaga]